METIEEAVARYTEDFALFDNANDKLEYIFDLGKKHTTLPEELKNDDTFIVGCASPAWLVGECKDGRLILRGEGTSEMAKGMITLLMDIFGNKTAKEILEFNPEDLNKMGIVELLSPVRQKSLQSFLEKVYSYAKKCSENG